MFAPRHHRRWRTSCRCGSELGGADDLQLPRPADQPGRRRAPADRRLGPPLPGDDRRGACRTGDQPRPRRRVRGRARRALGQRSRPGSSRCRRADGGAVRRARPSTASSLGPVEEVAGGSPEENAAAPRASWPAARERAAISRCSTPVRRSMPAAGADDLRGGVSRAARQSTPGRPRRCWTGWSRSAPLRRVASSGRPWG